MAALFFVFVTDGLRGGPARAPARRLRMGGRVHVPEALSHRPLTIRSPSRVLRFFYLGGPSLPERVRAISMARLSASPRLHLPPIDVIVYDGPVWRSYLGGGFVLRCFQHLSWPKAATRRCGWRHNRLTGASSDTVLSY